MIKDERVMSIINILSIEKAIDECKCPEPMICTVATTYYEQHTRERMCMGCWLKWCDKNGVEIDYGEN